MSAAPSSSGCWDPAPLPSCQTLAFLITHKTFYSLSAEGVCWERAFTRGAAAAFRLTPVFLILLPALVRCLRAVKVPLKKRAGCRAGARSCINNNCSEPFFKENSESACFFPPPPPHFEPLPFPHPAGWRGWGAAPARRSASRLLRLWDLHAAPCPLANTDGKWEKKCY